MQSIDQPLKVAIPFADDGVKRAIPDASQIGITNGAASFTDGFPPLTFLPVAAGGVPPNGSDFNGLFNRITEIQRWQSAGGLFKYDAAFSAAIEGYPKGARILNTEGSDVWINTVEGNTTDPDGGGSAGWISLSSASGGASLIKNVGQVVSSIAAVRLLLKTSPSRFAIATGYRAGGDGGGGMFALDIADTTTADDGCLTIVAADGGRWKRTDIDGLTLKKWGCYGDGSTDDLVFAQRATNYACLTNGVVRDDMGLNFKLSAPITVGIAVPLFRSIKFQGTGTGEAQTASSGGSCFIVTGATNCIVASFLAFANENISIDGFNFYNTSLNTGANSYAVKIIRGPANSRYISGFAFRNIGIMGFGGGFWFQGMNTVAVENNYFGNTIFDNVSMQTVGFAFTLANCVLNLLSMYGVRVLDARSAGIACLPDGDVGLGNGKGSSLNASLFKCHFEGVAGMFRTQTTATVGSLGVIRASISLYDFTHESCGLTSFPTVTGEPYALGVNTDLHLFGYQVQGMPFGEVELPKLNNTARIYSESPITVQMEGARSLTPLMVNAPLLRRSIASGGSGTITVEVDEAKAFALKSTLILAGGQGGFVESLHNGTNAVITRYYLIAGSPEAGVTLTWGTVTGAGAIQLTIDNASPFLYEVELQVENLSSSNILMPSEF